MAVAIPSGPTEPVNRSQEPSGRRVGSSRAAAGAVSGLCSVTSIEYRVWSGSPGYSVALS